ncbi:hypothetical protein ACQ4WX_46195 [Streptomyces lasalocidi]
MMFVSSAVAERVCCTIGWHLSKWMRLADIENEVKPGATVQEKARLRAARQRIKLLEQENEVLRRVAAYLSQANLPGNLFWRNRATGLIDRHPLPSARRRADGRVLAAVGSAAVAQPAFRRLAAERAALDDCRPRLPVVPDVCCSYRINATLLNMTDVRSHHRRHAPHTSPVPAGSVS